MKKKKFNWQQLIPSIIFFTVGAIVGFLIVQYIDSTNITKLNTIENIFKFILLLASFYIAMIIQIIIHELGHLIFGLLSGYKFVSFRIMNFMLIKDNRKIKLKNFSLAGTQGQCLMSPPNIIDGKLPVCLYNIGGSIMNIIASIIFLILYLFYRNVPFWSIFFLITAIIGITFAITNGIPMCFGSINNDGYNAISLKKNTNALFSFWVQLKINEQITKGVILKDMPDHWFFIPTDEEMQNSMIAVIGVLTCNRLMNEHNFEKAKELIKHFIEIDSGIVGIHRYLMICDYIYCELIMGNYENATALLTNEQLKFMNSMKRFPSILRTKYVYALLKENDKAKAQKIKKYLEKLIKSYPYPVDIYAEMELMEIAKNINNKR